MHFLVLYYTHILYVSSHPQRKTRRKDEKKAENKMTCFFFVSFNLRARTNFCVVAEEIAAFRSSSLVAKHANNICVV